MRTKPLVVLGLAATAAVAVVSLASASPATRALSTIHTIQIGYAAKYVDADRNGKPSIGDYTVFQARHLDPKTKKVIGGGTAICTQLDLKGLLYDCQGEDHFAGGDLRESARFVIGKGFTFAILGGTGAYVGASGELKGTWLDAKLTKAQDTFNIVTG
jgi:hypothetical protein